MSSLISNKWIDRFAFSRDASVYRLVPEYIAKPNNEIEIQEILKFSRKQNIPITFRAGGTSLSGQSLGEGLIVEILHKWNKFSPIKNGRYIKSEPGTNGTTLNNALKKYNKRIGPDPASLQAASIGGIVSNNSSGMMCGTAYNSYHTLKDIIFIMHSGNRYDSSNDDDRIRFAVSEKNLCSELLKIKKDILSNPSVANKIRSKYMIKNTMGYGMNSFLDFEDPFDIFIHLLIGSEGTLAFISSITLKTIDDLPFKATSLIRFKSVRSACQFLQLIKNLNIQAIEFMDDMSLKTVKYLKEKPYSDKSVNNGQAGLLIDIHRSSIEDINTSIKQIKKISLGSRDIINDVYFHKSQKQIDLLWKVRKGLYPTVGSMRKKGTSVITEDVAVAIENFEQAIIDLKSIFKRWFFNDAVIFGHAKDGNIHFVTSVDLSSEDGIHNYESMMKDLSLLINQKFNGSLKAEHGTGRNMAPFVEFEWGGVLYDMMWQVKVAADPDFLLNPDVILSKNKSIHTQNIKHLPYVNKDIELCIECGFCETSCPSSGYTLSPRQRIVVMREFQNATKNVRKKVSKDFDFYINETCATDGLCSMSCPVGINTGLIVRNNRDLMVKTNFIHSLVTQNFKYFIIFLRLIVRLGKIASLIIGNEKLNQISKKINLISGKTVPVWPINGLKISKNNQNYYNRKQNIDYLIFSSCVNRVFSNSNSHRKSLDSIFKISEKVNDAIKTSNCNISNCCGMAFSSHGLSNEGDLMSETLYEKLFEESNNGLIPIIIDNSSCSLFFKEFNSKKTVPLKVLDIVEYLYSISHLVKNKVKVVKNKVKEPVNAFPTCSISKMGLSEQFYQVIRSAGYEPIKTGENQCCSMAGDKGFKYTDLNAHASKKILNNVELCNQGVTCSITCGIGLENNSKIPFKSISDFFCESLE